jgi:hypothetical protein
MIEITEWAVVVGLIGGVVAILWHSEKTARRRRPSNKQSFP